MLEIVSICLTGASMITGIVGTAIPYWVHGKIQSIPFHSGLWKTCATALGQTQCVSFPFVPDVLKETRGLVIVGLILVAAAAVLGLFKMITKKDSYTLLRVAGACAILAGALIIIGSVIYAVRIFDSEIYTEVNMSLYAGFGLAIVAGVLAKVGGWMFFIAARMQPLQQNFNKF